MSQPPELSAEVIRQHYGSPVIKAVIQDYCRKGSAFRAGNGDFIRWYSYEGDSARLFDLTNNKDYEYLTSNYRTLYATLNIFDESVRQGRIPAKKEDRETDARLGDFSNTLTYTPGIDIDLKGEHKINEPESRAAMENALKFLVERFRQYGLDNVHLLFGGNGCYLLYHHEGWTVRPEWSSDEREYNFNLLASTFNAFITDLQQQFYFEHPQYKDFVKFDAINNRKRIFKTIFSVHKSNPYAVIPLDKNNILIDLKKATLPLSQEVLDSAKLFYKSFDLAGVSALKKKLAEYEDRVEVNISGRYANTEVSIASQSIGVDNFPPCIQNIMRGKIDCGQTRAITLLTTFLGQCGWTQEFAQKVFDDVARKLQASKSNIFESWFTKMNCPSCKTIQTPGSGFPHLNLGGCGVCMPNNFCGSIKSPVDYAFQKAGINSKVDVSNLFLSDEQLMAYEIPKDFWLVENQIPKRRVGLLVGKSGEFKSWLGQYLANCIAAGLPFLNDVVAQGGVYWFDWENSIDTMKRRSCMIRKSLGINTNQNITYCLQSAVKLDKSDLYNAVVERIANDKPLLVIFDGLQRCIDFDLDEDNAKVSALYTDVLNPLVEKVGCTILIISHLRKAPANKKGISQDKLDLIRGASEIRNTARFILWLEKAGEKKGDEQIEEQLVVYGVPKLSDAREPADKTLRFTFNDIEYSLKIEFIGEAKKVLAKASPADLIEVYCESKQLSFVTRQELLTALSGKYQEASVDNGARALTLAGYLEGSRGKWKVNLRQRKIPEVPESFPEGIPMKRPDKIGGGSVA